MARIRSIKPEFFTSESVGALSFAARLTFAGLWTHVDDRGRAKDNPRVIRGQLWPNDEETISSADVASHIDELVEHGMVCRYKHDGKDYLHVINMRKHQSINKPSASKLPECSTHADSSNPGDPGNLPDDSGNTPGVVPEDSRGEQGTGNREQGTGKEREETPSSSETATPPTDPPPPPDERDDVERICKHLADRIEGNGSRRPNVTAKWRAAARLMLDRDGRAETDIHAAIDWCQNHEFWRGNVMSLPKLRDKYDQLRLQAGRERASPPPRRTDGIDWDAAMARAAARDAAEASNHTPEDTLPWEP